MNPEKAGDLIVNDRLNGNALRQQVQRALDAKTKPPGSLGTLEALALQIAVALRSARPALHEPQLVVFAADHGIVAQGVSAYPQSVTRQMLQNFLSGGAAVNVLARQHSLALTVADCGVAGAEQQGAEQQSVEHHAAAGQGAAEQGAAERARSSLPGLRLLRAPGLECGTADSSLGPAMTPAQCAAALQNGHALVDALPGNVLLLGEMGIGNTSAAALLMARLTGIDLQHCVGRGTGLDDAGLQRKRQVLQRALQANPQANPQSKPHASSPLQALAALGGAEIATMTGAVQRAAQTNRLVVVDGFITTAAVAVAAALEPSVLQSCVFAHQSGEAGHARWLQHLGVQPLLNLGLRLGEGSGAALAWPLLQSACRILEEMATFQSAGVSTAIDGNR